MNNERFYFGPLVLQYNVDNTLIEELKNRGNKSDVYYNKNLAGFINEEKSYNKNDIEWFSNAFLKYLSDYANQLHKYGHFPKQTSKLKLTSLWINYMKAGEFNPIHSHDGDLSFVIYLDVPSILEEKSTEYITSASKPGSIDFFYCESQHFCVTNYNYFPKTGDMIIFPATLKHMVNPFYLNVERVSVSGNISFI